MAAAGALRALIWDVDGTVAETERDGHRLAFNEAFQAHGLPWYWGVSEYGPLLSVTGGRERLLHYMAMQGPAWPGVPAQAPEREALARRLHAAKNERYAARIARGGMPARPGVHRLMEEARSAGVALAVATTTSRSNVDALFESLFGSAWERGFATVVCAEDAPQKKPHPQAYQLALQRMGVGPDEAFAIEDSPNGLQAAQAAGIACGITLSAYFRDASFEGAAWVCDDLESPQPMRLTQCRAPARRQAD
jgi:HAD superfamily hydrolase (TIGR01509 family)